MVEESPDLKSCQITVSSSPKICEQLIQVILMGEKQEGSVVARFFCS